MYISRVVVRNYRNLRHLDLRLGSGATCVLGENNSGKTNLLHAIRLPLDATLSSYHRNLTEHDITAGVDASRPEQVIVSLEFSDFASQDNASALVGAWQVSDGLARLTYRFRPRPNVLEQIASEGREGTGLTLEDYHWEITGGGTVDPAEAACTDALGKTVRFADLQYFLVVFLPAMRDVQQDVSQNRFSPLSRLFTASEIPQEEKDALLDILREANNDIAASPAVSETSNAISSAFKSTAGDAFAMDVRLGLSDPTFTSIARSLTLLLTDPLLKDFETARNGLGLNNILYVSMLLEYFQRRMQDAKTAGQLLLFEEPEAHLHPQLQRVLYQALTERGCQALLTTHSTHVSSRAPIASYVTLTRTDSGVAPANLALAAGLTEVEQRDLERYLDATRSTLLFARKVMLVEGPAEAFLIPPLVKKLMNIDLDRHGMAVVPIHGVHFSPYAKLFTREALSKKCAIVADADLRPSDSTGDAAGFTDPDIPERLSDLESEFVKVFACERTFEVALAIPGMLSVLAEAAADVGAPRIASSLRKGKRGLDAGSLQRSEREGLLEELGNTVLATAIRVGKARFAQVASRHIDLAEEMPEYIRDAVKWLIE